jgi:multiple sugar transport system permease protein
MTTTSTRSPSGTDTPKRTRPRTRRSTWIARIWLIAASVVLLLPVYWMVITALKSSTELAHFPPTLFPEHIEWRNVTDALNALPFLRFFMNSAIITVASVLGAVVSNFSAAYAFSCLDWRGRDKVFLLVLATLFIPFPLAIIPIFDLFSSLHWINTYLPLIVPHCFTSAFFIFLLRQFLLQIPKDFIEAARVDGANHLRIATRIVFPMARPALAAVAIFQAIASWNDFLGPLIYLQDRGVQTLSIGLQVFRSENDVQYNQLMVASLLTVLPLVLLFFLFQKHFINGITLGGFK